MLNIDNCTVFGHSVQHNTISTDSIKRKMINKTNFLKTIKLRSLIKHSALILLGCIWMLGILITATRPIYRILQQPLDNLASPIIQNNAFHPQDYQALARQVHHAAQQINSDQILLWIQSDINKKQYRQLQIFAQLWVYPKALHNNPILEDIRQDQLPDLIDRCQVIQEAIALCPYSE
jgi:hypothetical protein